MAVIISSRTSQPQTTDTAAGPPTDPRSVCNLILDESIGGIPITNVALQRLLYLTHGIFLAKTKRPLAYGYFEAWRDGPVHPAAHAAFKAAGPKAIDFRAVKWDPFTGRIAPIPLPTDSLIINSVKQVMRSYGRMPTHHLIELCQAPNTPWDSIADKARTSMVLGMVIPDDLILERFKYHKIAIDMVSKGGCPSEDRPYS